VFKVKEHIEIVEGWKPLFFLQLSFRHGRDHA
jgi:hypothetical protein